MLYELFDLLYMYKQRKNMGIVIGLNKINIGITILWLKKKT